MEPTEQLMMRLISFVVCGKSFTPVTLLTDNQLTDLFRLAKAHDLAHLIAQAILDLSLTESTVWVGKCQQQIFSAVHRYEKIQYELQRLETQFSEAQIPYIPLKGAVIRAAYPAPWMRTSCDIDILIHDTDLAKASALLQNTLAYEKRTQGSHDVGFFSPSGVHLELHYSLLESDIIGQAEQVLTNVWDFAYLTDTPYKMVLQEEMFTYYHIAHMAKHFQNGGCGVRPFLDLWLLEHRIPHDKERRDALLWAGGLTQFAEAAKQLADVWFDAKPGKTEELTQWMQEYILSGGVYGTVENNVMVGQVQKGSKLRYALSRIWLPYEKLKFYYPALAQYRWLLPLYEVRRWCRLLFCGGVKRSVRELQANQKVSEARQAQTRRMLAALALSECAKPKMENQ